MLSITIPDMSKLISVIYDRPDTNKTVLCISGESGIGKTEIVLQTVASLHNFSEVRVINVAHLSIEDMGIPVNTDSEYLSFKLSKLFAPATGGKKVLILLDELNRASNDSVMNFLMGAICERRLFGHTLHDSINFMATLNPNNDSYPETRPIFDDLASRRRFNIISLRFDADVFLNYSRKIGIEPVLLDFLLQNPDVILIPGAVNTPRQWFIFDKEVLKSNNIDYNDTRTLNILSSLYMDLPTCNLWTKFYLGSLERFISPDEILLFSPYTVNRLETHIKDERLDLLEASCKSLTHYLKNTERIDIVELENIIRFILLLPRPLSFTLINDLVLPGGSIESPESYSIMNDIIREFYKNSEIMNLILSGVSKAENIGA